MPPFDLVLLSHLRSDQVDSGLEGELDKRVPIVTLRGAADELHKRGFMNIYPMEAWSNISVAKGNMHLRIMALPEGTGSLLEFYPAPQDDKAVVNPFQIYIGGATRSMDALRELPTRYPEMDLALLHLGGMMDEQQGIALLQLIHPKDAIALAPGDEDAFRARFDNFQNAVEQAGLANRVHYLAPGETFTFDTP